MLIGAFPPLQGRGAASTERGERPRLSRILAPQPRTGGWGQLRAARWASKGAQPWGHGDLGARTAPRAEPPSPGGCQVPNPSKEPSTPSRTARTKPIASQFLEGEAGSEHAEPATRATRLRLHFPEAGDQGKPKLAGD